LGKLKSVFKAIRKRNTLFRIAKQTGRPTDHAKYKAKHNQLMKMLRESEQTFFDQCINNADTKMFGKLSDFLNHDYSLKNMHPAGW